MGHNPIPIFAKLLGMDPVISVQHLVPVQVELLLLLLLRAVARLLVLGEGGGRLLGRGQGRWRGLASVAALGPGVPQPRTHNRRKPPGHSGRILNILKFR